MPPPEPHRGVRGEEGRRMTAEALNDRRPCFLCCFHALHVCTPHSLSPLIRIHLTTGDAAGTTRRWCWWPRQGRQPESSASQAALAPLHFSPSSHTRTHDEQPPRPSNATTTTTLLLLRLSPPPSPRRPIPSPHPSLLRTIPLQRRHFLLLLLLLLRHIPLPRSPLQRPGPGEIRL